MAIRAQTDWPNPRWHDKATCDVCRTWNLLFVEELGGAAYAWSRAVGYAQVTPIKGVETFNRSTPVSGPTFVDATIGGKRLRRGARLWTIAVSTFKAETYRFLRLERPSDEDRALGVCDAPGTMHLPAWADTEWLKQLVAEQMVTTRPAAVDHRSKNRAGPP